MRASTLLTTIAWAAAPGLAVVQLPWWQLGQSPSALQDSWIGALAVNITLGTPPQKLALALNAGGPQTFVPWTEACGRGSVARRPKCLYGSFDNETSTTFLPGSTAGSEDDRFRYLHGDSWTARGDWMQESLSLTTDMTVTGLDLGLTYSGNHWLGVLGLGFNETRFQTAPTFMDRLLQVGAIKTTAFSLWPDSPLGSTGQLLLGAIDRSKFDGQLQRLEAARYLAKTYDFTVQMYGLKGARTASAEPSQLAEVVRSYGQNYEQGYATYTISFNPTAAITNLPLKFAQPIWDLAGATYSEIMKRAVIPCSAANNATGRIVFEFGDIYTAPAVIEVPIRDLVLSQVEWGNEALIREDGSEAEEQTRGSFCEFGIQSINETYRLSPADGLIDEWEYVIGRSVLRRTYVVMDLVNEEVAIAPLKATAAATTDIIPFATYGAVIPESTRIGRPRCTWQTTEQDGCSCLLPEGCDHYQYQYSKPALSAEAFIGIGVGSGLAALLLVVVIIFAFASSRRKKRAAAVAKNADSDGERRWDEKGGPVVKQLSTIEEEPEEDAKGKKELPPVPVVKPPLPPAPAHMPDSKPEAP